MHGFRWRWIERGDREGKPRDSGSYRRLQAGLLAWGLVGLLAASAAGGPPLFVTYEPAEAPKGKTIVLVSGDEEYRSEEVMPALGKILAVHHGFRCHVLFAVDPRTGKIDPNCRTNIPGLELLRDADLMVIFTRFRDLPDEQMAHIAAYVESGKPVIGLRTATHAFRIPSGKRFAAYDFRSKQWDGGFGRQILGETWIAHHGRHGRESTRGVVAPEARRHPVVRGIRDGDIWGPTDVYRVRLPLPAGCQVLIRGQVLSGMRPDDPPVAGAKNDPMMPIAWVRTMPTDSGSPRRVFTTTMGAAGDFASAGLRRLLVNAVYWCLGEEEHIRPDFCVDLVGQFHALPFGMNGFRKGVRPADHVWPPQAPKTNAR